MNILDKIVAHKHTEIEERKSLYPLPLLQRSLYYESPTVSLGEYLSRPGSSGIIAEFKRASPSEGDIHPYAEPAETTRGYMQAGAAALSVLTDSNFFKGKSEDLEKARATNYCPILRKDFVLDPYQIHEARSIGADAVLLIAAILEPGQIRDMAGLANELGMEVLLEVRDEEELRQSLTDAIRIVGINNRNLKDFSVDIGTSIRVGQEIPADRIKVSESGISDPNKVIELRKHGFSGFLIGSHFMRQPDPAAECRSFIREVKKLSEQEALHES